MHLIAIVGMPGAGKTELSKVFQMKGFHPVRFGDLTMDELKKRGLEVTPENERFVREDLRKHHGPAAYALMNKSRIDSAIKTSNVVIDGLYSWSEYLELMKVYGNKLIIVAVCASPKMRHSRLEKRTERPLTNEEARTRDLAELESLQKGKPIAMADYTLLNEKTLEDLPHKVETFLKWLEDFDVER